MEATSGFEPENRGFADLPLNHLGTSPRGYESTQSRGSWLALEDSNLGSRNPKSGVLPLDEGPAVRRPHPGPAIRDPARAGSMMIPMGDGAEDGTRTRDPHLGKVMLYQLSHFRLKIRPFLPRDGCGAESQIRTGDTAIFSRVLYRLSYLGPQVRRRLFNHILEGSVQSGQALLRGGVQGGCPVSARRRSIRSTMGGWVENRPLERVVQLLDGVDDVQVLGRPVGHLQHLGIGGDLGQRPLQAVRDCGSARRSTRPRGTPADG